MCGTPENPKHPLGFARTSARFGTRACVLGDREIRWIFQGGYDTMTNTPLLASPRANRFTVDQHETMGYPLCPIGRTLDEQVIETSATRIINYDAIGWQIELPTGNDVPTTILYDVYYGFMWLWREAGFPDDGIIWFSRYNFLQSIGWVSNGRNGSGGRLVKPSGRHYQQLEDACRGLVHTMYSHKTTDRSRGYNVLIEYDLVADEPGRRPLGEQLPRRSKVVFNPAFIQRIKSGAPLVEMDLDRYLQLSTGAPRVLYRILSWMQHIGIDSLPLEPFMHRMGSVQKKYVPAVCRKILRRAVPELIAYGVLEKEPDYERGPSGEYYIVFAFADPDRVRRIDDALVREAVACGVNVNVARNLVVAHRERFLEVMVAVATGRIRASRHLAARIVAFTQQPTWTIPSNSPSLEQLRTSDSIEDRYRAWIIDEQDRLVRAGQVDADVIRREIVDVYRRQNRETPPPEWHVEGLVRMVLSARLGMPTLAEYAARVAAGRVPQMALPPAA